MINGYIALTKPRIISLLLVTALGGLFLASEGFPSPITTLVVLVGGSIVLFAVLLQFFNRKIV